MIITSSPMKVDNSFYDCCVSQVWNHLKTTGYERKKKKKASKDLEDAFTFTFIGNVDDHENCKHNTRNIFLIFCLLFFA